MDWQNIVITGASSGVGGTLARRLAAKGKKVFALARNQDKLRGLEEESGSALVALPVDVRRPEQIAAAFEMIEQNFGPIDVLVNNAALFQWRDFWTQELEVMADILDTNLMGTLFCTRLVLAYMLKRRRGHIVNIASVAGLHGVPGQAAYCASKHGMIGFADALAQELQPHGIKITTICPGGIDTPLWDPINNPYPGNKEPLIKVEEIADLIEFILAKPDSTIYKRVVLFPENEWH